MKNDRIVIHQVAHEGGVMLDIQAADNDHPRIGGWLLEVDIEGNIGVLFRNNNDVPYSLVLHAKGIGVTVSESEDLFCDDNPVWNSNDDT